MRATIAKNTDDPNIDLDVKSYADYYPFGMKMPGKFREGSYRYAYQGQEKDQETGFEAFELRQWDGRIGRWMSTDPYGQYASPYLGMGNNPVNKVDPDGGLDVQVLNSNGKVVYEDPDIGIGDVWVLNEGAIWTGDYADATQIASCFDWVGSLDQKKWFVESQMNFVTSVPEKWKSYGSGYEFVDRDDFEMRTSNTKLKSGFYTGKSKLSIRSNSDLFGNVYNFRNTVRHESYHSKPKGFEATSVFEEKNAIDFQMKGKWYDKTSKSFKIDVNNYLHKNSL